MNLPDWSPKKYPPVGRCIYCGTSDSRLTDEHIIPFGLEGRTVFPKSSCLPCAKITGSVEQFCLRTMFGVARAHLGLGTRRPKERPPTFALRHKRHDGYLEAVPVKPDSQPILLHLVKLAPPGIVVGEEPKNVFENAQSVISLSRPADILSKELPQFTGMNIQSPPIEMSRFSRMLAKIAHSFAVAERGIDSFTPLLPELILGRYDTPSYLVGRIMGSPIVPPDGLLHHLFLEYIRTDDGSEFLVANIRLFAILNTPHYHVVIARTKSATPP